MCTAGKDRPFDFLLESSSRCVSYSRFMNSATMGLLRDSQERVEQSLKLIRSSDELIRELDAVILERKLERKLDQSQDMKEQVPARGQSQDSREGGARLGL